jgi:putative phosphoribosyl transferase
MKIGALVLPAEVIAPEQASAVVIFALGSGSSRLSPRNQQVAQRLNQAGIVTVLFDLLTEEEAADRRNVFNIPLLASRMSEAISFVQEQEPLSQLPIGLFGASTGAAAALMVAADRSNEIGAIVSRGGRPDLALPVLALIKAPTLLIVGEYDEQVIELNRTALKALNCVKKLEIVPGATHLFEEPGTLDRVAELAARWFNQHPDAKEGR